MPIIKSAIKRMKQNQVNHARNRHYGSHMKSMIKLLLGHVAKGEMDKANKILPDVISSIDTASKKRIIHENNAANKKSRVQRAINAGPVKKEEKPVKAKAAPKKVTKAAKKTKATKTDE
ncbi:30S ribosomal protein S20 [Patescibacteria group bacterium]|nr:30S ribosomal protein S20 [Patescibacteria group bacterium]MBU1015828.1 30S ribosomal protein S20 [Patescibacteria group bacterium]MBU1685274.1 30S ribosomal protein S20 [Patescibacteria group bacterium]MBU1938471.1 30S ribosomal protein S20 [Patescibacteria group bacterium]